ncbi:hypothetical protein EYF80_007026 [Liparis tanakae]|uniref:Uncharacterized protein n=1 Tax=Liparis tanakae TaxID=230148 RepID=A0A4Z2IXS2_9TELE|nr:hypothetical protein EYF80_007026 [Liparis tanakae]
MALFTGVSAFILANKNKAAWLPLRDDDDIADLQSPQETSLLLMEQLGIPAPLERHSGIHAPDLPHTCVSTPLSLGIRIRGVTPELRSLSNSKSWPMKFRFGDTTGRRLRTNRKGRMGLTTAFSASGLITVSSDREAGKEEDSGRERCTGGRRDKRKTGVEGQGLGLMRVPRADGGGEKDTGDGGEAERGEGKRGYAAFPSCSALTSSALFKSLFSEFWPSSNPYPDLRLIKSRAAIFPC